jgi:hypothetical protein
VAGIAGRGPQGIDERASQPGAGADDAGDDLDVAGEGVAVEAIAGGVLVGGGSDARIGAARQQQTERDGDGARVC